MSWKNLAQLLFFYLLPIQIPHSGKLGLLVRRPKLNWIFLRIDLRLHLETCLKFICSNNSKVSMQLFDRDYEVEDPCQDHGMWTLRQSFRPN